MILSPAVLALVTSSAAVCAVAVLASAAAVSVMVGWDPDDSGRRQLERERRSHLVGAALGVVLGGPAGVALFVRRHRDPPPHAVHRGHVRGGHPQRQPIRLAGAGGQGRGVRAVRSVAGGARGHLLSLEPRAGALQESLRAAGGRGARGGKRPAVPVLRRSRSGDHHLVLRHHLFGPGRRGGLRAGGAAGLRGDGRLCRGAGADPGRQDSAASS